MRKLTRTLDTFLFLSLLGSIAYFGMAMIFPPQVPTTGGACSKEDITGCTVFTISKGEQVFFGGNDDCINPDSYYWVDPGDGQDYGPIWIGYPDNVQQGVNEKGWHTMPTGCRAWIPTRTATVNRFREITPST